MNKPPNLLIIDDNEEILVALKDFFSANSFNVYSAFDGLEALKIIESENIVFDLIITDIVMPNISGVGIISIVKKRWPDVPVIAITGWGEHPEALAAEADADLIIEKPFDLAELKKKVNELLLKKP